MLNALLSDLGAAQSLEWVFNPWRDVDPENDIGPMSPETRLWHLRHYFHSRLESARILLVAEAMGYRGGHFSGIPLTSERMLLGHHPMEGLDPADILPGVSPRRTSNPEVSPLGFAEPTATLVWKAVLGSLYKVEAFVFWNAFAWHPYDPKKGMLSNRTPNSAELAHSTGVLKRVVNLFPVDRVIAVGRVASRALERLGIDHNAVRHPAQGGAKMFRQQCSEIF